MNRCALVTGAAGFVGRVLSAHLEAQGWDVRRADLAVPEDAPAETGFACDVSNPESVSEMLAWAGPVTHVFHLAAVTFVPDAFRNPARSFEINLNGTVYVATAMKAQCPEARLIFISSSEVYGPPRYLPVDEGHPFNPVNPYAIAKAAADRFCAFFHQAEGLDIVRLRPSNHSGPGQSDSFVLSSFAHQIARIEAGVTEAVLRVGNLEAARDFLHVNDVVRAYEQAALQGKSGEAYNVCSGRAVKIRDALEELCALAAVEITIETDPERVRSVDVPEIRGAAEKFRGDTGWQPEIPFRTLLCDILNYWRSVENKG